MYIQVSSRPGCSVFGFRFVGVISVVLVLLALRALPCVALRCLALFRVFSGRAELLVSTILVNKLTR